MKYLPSGINEAMRLWEQSIAVFWKYQGENGTDCDRAILHKMETEANRTESALKKAILESINGERDK